MSERVGRNPFQSSSKPKKSVSPEKPGAIPGAKARQRPRASGATRAPLLERLLAFRMERFSLLRFDRAQGRGKVSLLNVGLKNPKWKATGEFEWQLWERKNLALSLFSIRIVNA